MRKETLNKIIQTIEYLILPITGVASIWGLDIGVYVSSGAGALISLLSFVGLFLKNEEA